MQIWLFALIIILSTITICGLTLLDRPLWAPGVLAAVIAIFVRGAHHLGTHVPWWHDGYFYFTIVESIIMTGHLTIPPEIASWYGGAEILIVWPGLQLLTTFVTHVTGIDGLQPMMLIPPLLSVGLFTGAWALYKLLLGARWGLLAAYLSVMLDSSIYYLTEFHQQGLGFVMLVFVLALVYRSIGFSRDRRFLIPLLILLAALAISHRFSAAIVALLVVGLLFVLVVWNIFQSDPQLQQQSLLPIAVLFLVIVSSVYWFAGLVYFGRVINTIIATLTFGIDTSRGYAIGDTTAGETIIDRFPLLLKLSLTALATPAVVAVIRGRGPPQARWFVAAGMVCGAIAVPIMALTPGSWARMAAFGYLLIVPVAFLTLRWIARYDWPNARIMIGALIVCLVVMGTFAGSTPSLVDHNSNISDDGFHKIQPIGQQNPEAGEFIRFYISEETTIGTNFWTRMIPLYYGHHPQSGYLTQFNEGADMGVYDDARSLNPSPDANRIYANGRISITNQSDISQQT